MSAASSSSNQTNPFDKEVKELAINIIAQHTFVNETVIPVLNDTMLIRYKREMNSPSTNQRRRIECTSKYTYIVTFLREIRTKYEILFKEVGELKGTSNTETLEKKQEEFDDLNSELNRFIKSFQRSGYLPIRRVTSEHVPLEHRKNNRFTFTSYNNRGRSRNRNNATNRNRRNRSRSPIRSNVTNRNRNRITIRRSAIRNTTRAPRGHIQFREIANIVQTDPLGSRGNTTFSSAEIAEMGKIAKRQIHEDYKIDETNNRSLTLKRFRENMEKVNNLAREVAAYPATTSTRNNK